MPNAVVNRAWEVLRDLEVDDTAVAGNGNGNPRPNSAQPTQLALLPISSPALDELKGLDISSMTPIEAINKLYELQRSATEG